MRIALVLGQQLLMVLVQPLDLRSGLLPTCVRNAARRRSATRQCLLHTGQTLLVGRHLASGPSEFAVGSRLSTATLILGFERAQFTRPIGQIDRGVMRSVLSSPAVSRRLASYWVFGLGQRCLCARPVDRRPVPCGVEVGTPVRASAAITRACACVDTDRVAWVQLVGQPETSVGGTVYADQGRLIAKTDACRPCSRRLCPDRSYSCSRRDARSGPHRRPAGRHMPVPVHIPGR